MGKQQATAKAIEALHHALETAQPSLTQEQKDAIIKSFEQELRLHS